MKYKNIRSAGHNFADSFASSLNYDSDDYIMSHLARRVLETGERALCIDLLTGVATPDVLVIAPVARSLERRVASFSDHLRRQNIDATRIHRAHMRLLFEDARISDDIGFPNHKEIPFDAWVGITDDRGVEHVAHFRRWWSFRADAPEFGRPTLLTRFRTWWRGGA